MSQSATHTSHPQIVNRLKRAEGHLRSIVTMIEDERPCLDIAQQLHAVEKAVAQAKKRLVRDHIDNCLADAVDGGPHGRHGSMEELKAIAQYL
jgi:hypothetical protein NreA